MMYLQSPPALGTVLYQHLYESIGLILSSLCVQVLYGVPKGNNEDAQALKSNITKGLQGVMGAIDAK